MRKIEAFNRALMPRLVELISEPEDDDREPTRARRLRLEFWTEFRTYAESNATRFKPTKPSAQHWMNLRPGRQNVHLTAIALLDELRAELVLEGSKAKERFAALQQHATMIQTSLGEPLAWHTIDQIKSCRIYLARTSDLDDRNRWPEYHAWLTTKLDALHSALSGPLRNVGIALS
jgi:hypothetical protein